MNMSPRRDQRADVPAARRRRGGARRLVRLVPRRPATSFSVTDPFKWSPDTGAWAFGAGLSLGTLPDAGFAVNTKALLVVLLPGPVILLQGTADIFKPPAAFGGGASAGGHARAARRARRPRRHAAARDRRRVERAGRCSTSPPRTEAFFDFDRPRRLAPVARARRAREPARSAPTSCRCSTPTAWLMLDADGHRHRAGGELRRLVAVRAGAADALGLDRGDGVALDAAGAARGRPRPRRRGGDRRRAVRLGLARRCRARGQVVRTLPAWPARSSVVVGLPKPLKDLDVDIELEWSSRRRR